MWIKMNEVMFVLNQKVVPDQRFSLPGDIVMHDCVDSGHVIPAGDCWDHNIPGMANYSCKAAHISNTKMI